VKKLQLVTGTHNSFQSDTTNAIQIQQTAPPEMAPLCFITNQNLKIPIRFKSFLNDFA